MTRAVSLALALAVPVAADPLPERDVAAARAAVEGSLRDAAARDWAAYARRVDPAGLKSFRDDWAALLTAAEKEGRADQLLPLVAGARSAKAALAYPPEEFFARFMRGATDGAPSPGAGRPAVLGVVADGHDRAHAVVRYPGGPAREALEVVSVRRVGGEWRVEVPRALAGVAAAYRARGGAETRSATDAAQPEPGGR